MKILFNPFEKYTEKYLLLIGGICTLFGSLSAYAFHARFDGALDFHFTPKILFWQPFFDNFINVLCLTVFLFLAAKIVNRKARAVDILVVSLMARIPYYVLPLFNINNFISAATGAMVDPETLQIKDLSFGTLLPILIFVFIVILFLTWYITLLYNGFKVASHAKGTKPVILFICFDFFGGNYLKISNFSIHLT